MLHLNFSAILLVAMCQLSQALGSSKLQNVADPERAFNGLYTGVDGSRGSLHTFREDSLGLTLSYRITKGYRVPPTQYHDVVFVIKQRNLDTLTRILTDVSDPAGEEYGNHLSKEEIDDLTSNGDSNEVVLAYLKSVGAKVVIVECSGELITARAPISLWERILDTEFHIFSHKSESDASEATDETDTFIRSEKYSIPMSLDDHVAFVLNTIQIPQVQSRRYQPTEMPSDEAAKFSSFSVSSLYTEGSVSPQLLNDGYNIDDNTGHPRATQAALQGFGQVFSPEDLTTFQSYYGLPIQAVNKSQTNMTVTPEWCVINNLSICAESNLDIMYMMAVANTPTIHAYFRASSMASWFLNLAHSKNPPLVLSLSYGADENRITKGEALIMANAAIRLGVRGVTIIVAAGDDGVSSPYARSNPTQCGYVPSWPASCPYITSVGATQGLEMHQQEVVCQSDKGGFVTSGGGISGAYALPYWQKSHVDGYFDKVQNTEKQPYKGYSKSGRGYPDISAAGSHYLVVIGGNLHWVGGTSVGAPVIAGMVSLINAARFRAGGKPVGFLNPALYSNSSLFVNDITVGKNNCTRDSSCCREGFSAAPGWDPASGLGTLNFSRFKQFMLGLNPSSLPTAPPSLQPSNAPTPEPSHQPSSAPSSQPSNAPTPAPSPEPSSAPSSQPSTAPTSAPSSQPSNAPTPAPSLEPSSAPSSQPSNAPTPAPSPEPSSAPSSQPSNAPTSAPSSQPSNAPTPAPSPEPSSAPSNAPTSAPSKAPTSEPSAVPSSKPSATPKPSSKPSIVLTSKPSIGGTVRPTSSRPPALLFRPTRPPIFAKPSTKPSVRPTAPPSSKYAAKPSL